MDHGLRFLLLQVRNPGDPMASHELACFERCLSVDTERITIHDLLTGPPTATQLDAADVVVLGGSGDYSVARGGPWLDGALDAMVGLYESAKPTFASCWGFQAMARALGGEVVTDRSRAEVGTIWLELTEAGEDDPVFGPLGKRFPAQFGHEDIVTVLPDVATCLASSETIENEAFRIDGKPIYATQFHPELSRMDLVARITRYPSYLPLTGYETLEEFEANTPETPGTDALLARYLEVVVGAV